VNDVGEAEDDDGSSVHRLERPTVYAVCSVATDVTSEQRIEEALSFARETSESAHRQLDSLSNALADDLLAPLRSIDGFSQALLEDCGNALDDKSKSHLANVRQSAQRMATLIDSLLAMSQLSRSELRKDAVDLTELARNVAAQLRQTEPDRHVSFEIQPGLKAQGDPRLFGAVLQNLLGNSWKFTRRRQDAQIVVGENSERGTKVYFVKDNGTGFDMAHSGKLFSVFQTLHSRREFGGNGVGLATVQRIVNRHGGRVWAESTVDRGATFYFTIGEHFS
jgi:light-regulated signal transduction histidine kinase (bacteriophytochrome)